MSSKTKRADNAIYQMRRNRRLLQKQLAVLLGHKYTHNLSRYEHGVVLPPLETALLLEIALGIRLQDLFPGLYEQLQATVLKRCYHLPLDVRRGVIGRLLGEDSHEHT